MLDRVLAYNNQCLSSYIPNDLMSSNEQYKKRIYKRTNSVRKPIADLHKIRQSPSNLQRGLNTYE